MASGEQNPTLTIILTAHKEGLVAYRVLRAWQRTRTFAHRHNLFTRLIVVLDCADSITHNTIVDHRIDLWVDQIMITTHGDPGMARNSAMTSVTTPYVVIADGDDLPSENWLVAGHQVLTQYPDQDVVVHPEVMTHFGTARYWHRQINQTSPDCDLRQLVHHNYWSSAVITKTSLFHAHPYTPAAVGSGFGHEDWEWNTRVIAAGATHLVAPGTLRAYRHKEKHSVCVGHDNVGELTRANEFFADLNIFSPAAKYAPPGAYIIPPKRTQRAWRKLKKETPEVLPRWCRAELRALCQIEPDVSPVGLRWPHHDLRAPSPWPGEMYSRLLNLWPADAHITHLFIVPWLGIGGADKMARQYIDSVARNPHNRVAVLVTQKPLVENVETLPKNILWLVFTPHEAALYIEWQMAVTARLIMQRAPQVVHVINARVGWELLKKNGLTLSKVSRWYATAFCDNYYPTGEPYGYAHGYLSTSWPYLTQLFTDSQTYRQQLLTKFGLPADMIATHYTYTPITRAPQISSSKTLLWAGRLDNQKRPDILYKIAQSLPRVKFAVYGSTVLDQPDGWVDKLKRLPNVTMPGRYESFNHLPHDRFAGFLYTSQWDGLPNVLLEAAAAGLPIIAPNVGGVAELVTQPTGYLVDHFTDIKQYRSAINHLLEHPEYAYEKALRAQELIARRHNQEQWHSQLESAPQYFSASPVTENECS